METILAIIFGGAVVAYIYERERELKAERVQKLLSPKAEELIEISETILNEYLLKFTNSTFLQDLRAL